MRNFKRWILCAFLFLICLMILPFLHEKKVVEQLIGNIGMIKEGEKKIPDNDYIGINRMYYVPPPKTFN